MTENFTYPFITLRKNILKLESLGFYLALTIIVRYYGSPKAIDLLYFIFSGPVTMRRYVQTSDEVVEFMIQLLT
jgi:hypothetical protein